MLALSHRVEGFHWVDIFTSSWMVGSGRTDFGLFVKVVGEKEIREYLVEKADEISTEKDLLWKHKWCRGPLFRVIVSLWVDMVVSG